MPKQTRVKFTDAEIWANKATPANNKPVPPALQEAGYQEGEKPYNWHWNHLMRVRDEILVHVLQMGIADYEPGTVYYKDSLTRHKGKYYSSKNDNVVNKEPGAAGVTDWDEWLIPNAGNIASVSSGTTDGNKLVKTNTNGKIDNSLLDISVMRYRGKMDFTIPPPATFTPALSQGDFFENIKNGTADAGWAGIAGSPLLPGENIAFDGTEWDEVGAVNASVLSKYLTHDGSTAMTGPLTLVLAAPTNPTDATNKAFVDAELAKKADASATYTQAQVDAKIAALEAKLTAATYSKGVIDSKDAAVEAKVAAKANAADVYTKAQLNAKMATYVKFTDYATATKGGVVKMKLTGNIQYITNNGANA